MVLHIYILWCRMIDIRFTISFVLFCPQVSDKSISSLCVPLLFLLRSLRQPPLLTATPWSILFQQRYSSASHGSLKTSTRNPSDTSYIHDIIWSTQQRSKKRKDALPPKHHQSFLTITKSKQESDIKWRKQNQAPHPLETISKQDISIYIYI